MSQAFSKDTLLGFIVSGYRGKISSSAGEVLKALLASSKKEALNLATESQIEGGFHPTGIISEAELKDQIAKLAILKVRNRETMQAGFIVGGKNVREGISESETMVSILADSIEEALAKAIDINPDFQPTGCLSETQVKVLLNMVEKIRKNTPNH